MSADDDPSERLMVLFGPTGHRDQLPSAYSRGSMRQKLAPLLARPRAPRLLLLDRTVRCLTRRFRGVERAYRRSAKCRRGRAGWSPS